MRGAKISDKYRRDSEVASWIHDDILKLEAELNAAWSAVATMEEDNTRLEAERDALNSVIDAQLRKINKSQDNES